MSNKAFFNTFSFHGHIGFSSVTHDVSVDRQGQV
jgi:hypothetical protein